MITPMVAKLAREPFDREGWLFELKWDGFRCITEKDRQGVRLYSRNRNDFTKRFPVIAEQVSALDNVILDGELCALDEHGHPRFEWLINRGHQRGKLVLRVRPVTARRQGSPTRATLSTEEAPAETAPKKNDTLRYLDHVENDGLAMFAGALALGLEGVVAKDAKSPYVEGPAVTSHWLKIKNKNFQRKEPV